MIHYNLVCSHEHNFDGWFASSSGFDDQAARGLVECPVCGSVEVTRGLMAPALPKKGNAKAAMPTQAVAGEKMPDQVRAALQKLRTEIESKCDDVGDQFAAEARRIHNGESDKRGIYGQTTPDQAEALAEDGIGFTQIPWIDRADS